MVETGGRTLEPRERAIIDLLADGRPHSGESIAAALGISRAAVWKSLHKVDRALGLGIESARGQGYRLPAPLELLDAARIRDGIRDGLDAGTTCSIGRLEVLDEIDSTNAYLLARGRHAQGVGVEEGAEVCLAERQTAGRGRLGRRWVSPFGRNIYLSILWRSVLAPAQLGGLSLVCGVAVVRALRGLGVEGVGLKWPNDVHWQRRKLAGLLLEVAGEAQGPSLVVVGVGLNLGLRGADANAIDQPWVDLSEVCNDRPPGRNATAAELITALIDALQRYAEAGLAPFLDDWRARDAYCGESVTLIAGSQRIQGRYCGIDDQGTLLLETADGQRRFAAGEVSLRPLSPSPT
jgi:BirA family biotin operon repressor/biotin-[acetyl-CoA-carboxylase] ligase